MTESRFTPRSQYLESQPRVYTMCTLCHYTYTYISDDIHLSLLIVWWLFLKLPSTACRRVVALRNVVWNGSAVMNEEPHSSRRRREQRDFAEAKYRIVYVLIFMCCVSNIAAIWYCLMAHGISPKGVENFCLLCQLSLNYPGSSRSPAISGAAGSLRWKGRLHRCFCFGLALLCMVSSFPASILPWNEELWMHKGIVRRWFLNTQCKDVPSEQLHEIAGTHWCMRSPDISGGTILWLQVLLRTW